MHMKKTASEWNKSFSPGDLVLITAQFADGKYHQGLILKEIKHSTAPGYQILIDGKRKYFPPHLLKAVSCRKRSDEDR